MKPQVSISLLKLQVTAQSLLESLCEEGNDVYFPVFAPDLALGADKQDFHSGAFDRHLCSFTVMIMLALHCDDKPCITVFMGMRSTPLSPLLNRMDFASSSEEGGRPAEWVRANAVRLRVQVHSHSSEAH